LIEREKTKGGPTKNHQAGAWWASIKIVTRKKRDKKSRNDAKHMGKCKENKGRGKKINNPLLPNHQRESWTLHKGSAMTVRVRRNNPERTRGRGGRYTFKRLQHKKIVQAHEKESKGEVNARERENLKGGPGGKKIQ